MNECMKNIDKSSWYKVSTQRCYNYYNVFTISVDVL